MQKEADVTFERFVSSELITARQWLHLFYFPATYVKGRYTSSCFDFMGSTTLITLPYPQPATRSRVSFNGRLMRRDADVPAAVMPRPFPKDGEIASARYSNPRPPIFMLRSQNSQRNGGGWYAAYNAVANCGGRVARARSFSAARHTRGWRSIDWKLFQRLPSEMYAGGKYRASKERGRETASEKGDEWADSNKEMTNCYSEKICSQFSRNGTPITGRYWSWLINFSWIFQYYLRNNNH